MEDRQSIINIRFIFSLIVITIGAVIASAALELVLIPNLMIDGGIMAGRVGSTRNFTSLASSTTCT